MPRVFHHLFCTFSPFFEAAVYKLLLVICQLVRFMYPRDPDNAISWIQILLNQSEFD